MTNMENWAKERINGNYCSQAATRYVIKLKQERLGNNPKGFLSFMEPEQNLVVQQDVMLQRVSMETAHLRDVLGNV